ncbi:MAG TPA: twin transmembrane helix small protein [Caulobacteraceae bacterium]|nr:twin transmembrane helix small protein [Caulobacteraceae bacterium]
MHAVFNVLIPFCLFVVVAILFTGVYALMRGGQFGRKWSNKLMQMRVVAQATAILVLLAAFWWSRHSVG